MIVRTGKITDPLSLSPEERAHRVAGTDEWHSGFGNYITAIATRCVLFAAHNPAVHLGILGHFSAVSGDWGRRLHPETPTLYEGMDKFLKALNVVPLLGPRADTTVWVGGACAELDGEFFDDTEFERSYVLDKLGELAMPGYTILEPHWIDVPNGTLAAQLDCPQGILTIQEGLDRATRK